jgi:acyl carrier protein
MSVRDLWQAISIEARAILLSLPLVMGIYADWLTILSAHLRPGQERAQVVLQSSEPPIPGRRPIAFDADTERVRKIVVEHLGVEADKVVESANFIDDLGADSLDAVELIMAFEEEFDCKIAHDAAEHIHSVGDAVHYLRTTAKNADA